MVSHIPVNEDFPSLNLSHAVQLYAWELSQALGPKKQGGPKEADPGSMSGIDRKRQTALVEVFTDTLRVLGFYEKAGRPEQERFFLRGHVDEAQGHQNEQAQQAAGGQGDPSGARRAEARPES